MKTTNKELPINVSTLIKGMFYLILKGREGGKYKTRKKIVDKKTGKMRWGGYTYDRPKKTVKVRDKSVDTDNVKVKNGNSLKNKISQKIYDKYSQELHDLAKFNASLTKGYRSTLTDDDIKGYEYKNKKLQEFVNTAIEHKYPVFYRANVVYFIVGQKQISFHTGTGHDAPTFGLPSSDIEWDGVTNAYIYSDKEYAILKELRKTILEKRKENKKQKEDKLVKFGEAKIQELNKKLKRTKLEPARNKISTEIEKLQKEVNATWGKYGLYETFRKEMWVKFNPEINSLCNELTRIYRDDYIVNYML